MRQFVRFQHLAGEGADVWFARVNPKASVVPLIMDHFVERLGVQPFIIYDEVHHLAGVYDGGDWQSLLFRLGNVVVSVEGPVDFTDPDILSAVLERVDQEVSP